MKKRFSILAAILAFSLVFTACGGAPASAPAGTAGSSGSQTAAQAAQAEPVTITFEQFSGSGDNEAYLQQMIDAYTAQNPHVTIKLQSYGYDDYFQQLTAKVSGGQAPDVFELNYENFVSYAKKGALMPLDEIIASQGIDTGRYNKMALAAFNADGKQYGVPNSFSNVVLIYNKDLFDQAKADYPTDDWTWEDAMAAAEKIRALGDDIFGYYHPISFNEFYKTVKQNGGSLFNGDYTEFTMTDPKNVETLQYLVDMQLKTNVMPTPAQMGGMGDWDLFKSGRLGMIVTGIWAFPDYTANCDFNWDIAVEPGHTQKATHFFSNGYVISKDSKAAEEAAKFIAFISSDKEATQIRLDAAWELPPVIDEAIISQYKAVTPPDNREAVFKSLDYLVTPPVITQFAELQDIVGRHLSEAAAGTVTPEEALQNMQAECESKIDLSK
ncbi:ABC transporter substrate-binding protein [Allofournierella sp.]|uniref:ABC transporter substrate-binding protein n=1 Tax=Allofournierella sp. TaxID=1940256 RepID=UPI003AB24218